MKAEPNTSTRVTSMHATDPRPHVVIIGGGFAGLTAARTLLGREIREQLFGAVAELLHDLDDGMRPISVFFPYLPTSFHKKRDV